MSVNAEMLQGIHDITRIFSRRTGSAGGKFGLTAAETDVLAFLADNPERDTVSETAEQHMQSKANVSQSVESLIMKGMLCREQDETDRRRIHLLPADASAEPAKAVTEDRECFVKQLFEGFTEDERALYAEMNARIAANAEKLKGRLR